MIRLQVIMFLWILFLSRVLGVPTDEFGEFTKITEGDILPNEDKLLMNIVPGFTSDIVGQNAEILKKSYYSGLSNKRLKNLETWIKKGVTKKGLTFNIYNDDMRKAAVALFRLFQSVYSANYNFLKDWVEKNINREMYMYALRLNSLYGTNAPESDLLPPFILNPRFFVNAETILKAFTIVDDMKENVQIDPEIAEVDQYDYVYERSMQFFTINSNYSGWNRPQNGIDEEINYFREDVGLNSYYLGLHLLHPFWMSNEELDEYFPRHAEHYYYAHQQLMARYMLEKEHLPSKSTNNGQDESDYVPNLIYKNGLPFPTRSCIRGDWDSEKALIKSIDIAIKECIDRGLIILENGTTINMTDDNHVEELSRLIRANLDGVRTAKIIRSVFGYGSNRSPIDEYNPAPSLLHHPETSLRDPVYWYLIQTMLKYFTDYKNTMDPFDLTQYETENIKIVNEEDTNLNMTTYFHSYKFSLDYARNRKMENAEVNRTFISVKQRRLKHEHFEIKLVVEASAKMMAVGRIYLGPQCAGTDCWQAYSNFFELYTCKLELQEGYNPVLFSSKIFKKHSFDTELTGPILKSNAYSIYKFPDNLLIPRGLENGLNLTLFIMISPADLQPEIPLPTNNYRKAITLVDSKPLGFPFHRPAVGFKSLASNYRFFNVTVYHKRQPDETPGVFFSPNLY